MDTKRAYKWLTKSRTGGYSDWTWPEAGEWTPEIVGDLIMCSNGYHLVTEVQIVGEYMQDELWEVEYEGEPVEHDDKICVRRARLIHHIDTINERTLRLFAADCAERALHIFERDHPNDDRPRKAIEAARLFAEGKIDAAAGAAARAAAWAAAGAAARAAAWAAARDAAWAAARDAAWAAAWDAARDAAWDAARAAAWAAARDAAWAAARDAAWDAARAAARDAAWDAARAAEQKWQRARFRQYMEGATNGQ
jgi:hypothetical protein